MPGYPQRRIRDQIAKAARDATERSHSHRARALRTMVSISQNNTTVTELNNSTHNFSTLNLPLAFDRMEPKPTT